MTQYNDPYSDDISFGQPARKKSNARLIWGIVGCCSFFVVAFIVAICVAGYFGVNFVQSRQHADRGAAAYEKNDYEGAITHLDKALAIDSKYVDALVVRADCYRNLGDYEKALEDCNRCVEYSPKRASIYNVRGLVYDDMGETRKALEDFQKSYELGNKEPIVLSNVALTYRDLDEYENALEWINRGIQASPNDEWMTYHRGLILIDLEKYEDALKDFMFCLKRNRSIKKYDMEVSLETIESEYLDCLESLERFEDIDKHWQKKFKAEPKVSGNYRSYWDTLLYRKKYDEAEKIFRQARDVFKNDEDETLSLYRSWCGFLSWHVSEAERCLKCVDQYVEDTGGSENSLALQADIYTQLDRHADALAIYTKLIGMDTENKDDYLRSRAECFSELGDHKKALADYEEYGKSLEVPDDDYYYELAHIHEKAGDLEKAIESLTKAVAVSHEAGGEDYYICHYYQERGSLYEKTGDMALAEQDFDKAVEADEDCQDCRAARAKFRFRQDKTELALQDLNWLIEKENKDYSDGEYQETRAEVYDKMNEPEKAETDRNEAAKLKAAWEEKYGANEQNDDE